MSIARIDRLGAPGQGGRPSAHARHVGMANSSLRWGGAVLLGFLSMSIARIDRLGAPGQGGLPSAHARRVGMANFLLRWGGAVLLGFLSGLSARADVRPAALFQDHMVLQRGKPVRVFGDADPGERVVVDFAGAQSVVVAGPDGTWLASLPPMQATRNGRTLRIQGRNRVVVDDVVVGDVWLCSGQSNMAFPLGATGRPLPRDFDAGGIRQFGVGYQTAAVPSPAVTGKWVAAVGGAVSGFSAVAFHFALALHREHQGNVPVGIVLASVGGTTIEPWLAPEGLVGKPDLMPLAQAPRTAKGAFSLFNGMVAPLAPFSIAGIVWYQGENAESQSSGPDSYFGKMRALADGWRMVFEDDSLPFLFTLIAGWGRPPQSAEPVLDPGGGWSADTRLQQVRAASLPGFGMASALDAGVADDMHPPDKEVVGERLAKQALALTQVRRNIVANGPMLTDYRREGAAVVCSFSDAGGGLVPGERPAFGSFRPRPGTALRRFSIAGDDNRWFDADARIDGNRIRLSSPHVSRPRKIAYACWSNPDGANLYNRAGLPAAPFLVDDIDRRFAVRIVSGQGGTVEAEGVLPVPEGVVRRLRFVPDRGMQIGDVVVDGVSMGSPRVVALDPARSDTKVVVRWVRRPLRHTMVVVAGTGGRVSPVGRRAVADGGREAISIWPTSGNRSEVLLEGVPLGPRRRVVFPSVQGGARIVVRFHGGVVASSGVGGAVRPQGEIRVPAGSGRRFEIVPEPGWTIRRVHVDGRNVGAPKEFVFDAVSGEHSIDAEFEPVERAEPAQLPRPDALWLNLLPDALLATEGFPAPETEVLGGSPWLRFRSDRAPGVLLHRVATAIPVDGMTVGVLAKPLRNGIPTAWTSLVDCFYDRLVLGIRNDTGQICVRRNGSMDVSEYRVPDGAAVVVFLTVRRDGSWEVYCGGDRVMEGPGEGAFVSLVPGVAGPFADRVTVGRNAPDAWTSFEGWIHTVRIWNVALTEAERAAGERALVLSAVR